MTVQQAVHFPRTRVRGEGPRLPVRVLTEARAHAYTSDGGWSTLDLRLAAPMVGLDGQSELPYPAVVQWQLVAFVDGMDGWAALRDALVDALVTIEPVVRDDA